MDLERSTYSNIEHQNINFVVYTLRHLFVIWEQEIRRSLLQTKAERALYYAEFNAEGLLRGDSKTRAEVNQIRWQCGSLSVNEWRDRENENGIGPRGDIYWVPLNMADADKAMTGDIQNQVENNALFALSTLLTRNSAYKNPGFMLNPGQEMLALSTAQIRSASNRSAISKKNEAKFTENAADLIKKEIQDIKEIARKTLQGGDISLFLSAISEFYNDFPEQAGKSFNGSFMAMAKDIFAEAAKEINCKGKWDERMIGFVEKYLASFANRHVQNSKAQLKTVVLKASANGQTELEAVEQRLEEWEETRPGKIGQNESVRLAGAIAKTAFAIGGITRIMWVNMGSKSCPYCEEMDGKIVGIEQNFVSSGGNVDGGEGSMSINQNTGHPPLHQGCACQIVSA
jgi:hypothetical protein